METNNYSGDQKAQQEKHSQTCTYYTETNQQLTWCTLTGFIQYFLLTVRAVTIKATIT